MRVRIRAKSVLVPALLTLCIASGAAPAQALNWSASSYPTTASGTSGAGNEVFGTEAGNLACGGSFSGSLAAESETLTIAPIYKECTAFGFLSATVAVNECKLVWHTNEKTDITCPTGQKIVITSGTCEVTIAAQTGLDTFSVSNKTGDVEVKVFLSHVNYTVTKDGFGCAFSGTGARTNGTWKETVAVTMQGSGGATITVH